MEVISQRSSALNPNAPIFVPLAYRTVEDFSEQWWALVHSSPCFRDYWLRECFSDPVDVDYDDHVLLDDLDGDDFFVGLEEEEKETDFNKELVPIGAMKCSRGRSKVGSPRYAEKAPKIVNVKLSPRTIHQPR
ncbi:hypothetical protein SLEP1_g5959 [Rubroshorea leprosula]|uniref:Ataxin-2 C-terminal domain-containing protein n=1 Tax=Rubroshorea leprosula TaxID=152421 RepID=A0AAV5I3G9_9ROSI|nr:hypothetical protein SLEP1_g5959 [Rubroshorea leprosula]